MSKPPEKYRPNVAIIVLNKDGKILACQRSDREGAWQLPQGGIDPGESREEAMYRELEEEIGTRAVELIGSLEKPIRYEWPEEIYVRGFRGQEQHYFLVRLREDARIDLLASEEQEFDKIEWLGSAEFISRLEGFKSEAYSRAIQLLNEKYPGLIEEN